MERGRIHGLSKVFLLLYVIDVIDVSQQFDMSPKHYVYIVYVYFIRIMQ